MQIFNDKKERIGNLQRFTNRSVTTTLSSGDKELSFEYPAHGNMVDKLQAEYYIRTETDEYVLKSIEEGETMNKYLAVLNVEELEGAVFPTGFESVEQTIRACLEFAFEDAGWKVGNCDITKKRTVRIDDHTTAWEVLQQALSTYRCECIINSLTKTVDIYEQVGSDKGCYFIEGLNLRKLTLKTDTYDFYTRIYPMGKDGITPFEAIGKPYLDNFQYSTKVKAYVWKDERYTVTTNLIEDAEAKLEEMSKPYRAFTADVVDLARMSKKYKEILSYGIGDTITLISKKTRIKEKQRIVKITEYPEKPEKNTVEISNARKTFAELQKTESELSKVEAISAANSAVKKTLMDDYYTKKEVESCISAAADKITLSVKETYVTNETYKTGIEDVKKDATEKANAAESNAKADTDAKLKSYSTTTEMEAAIKLAADNITSTVSKTYVTTATYETGISDAKKDATEKANAAESNAKADTDAKLKKYSTTTEMQSAIKQTAEDITSTVSKTYVTSADYETGIEGVKNDTDEKLKNYSTTTEMNSAIKQASDSITSTVSKTYVTSTTYEAGISNAKKDATEKANAAESNAKADTDTKLKNYSTTTEMQSAIKQTAESITSEVSKKTDADTVKSLIEQQAESIRLQAKKIEWSSDHSSMTEDGILTCEGANIIGNFETRQTWNDTYKKTTIREGVIEGYIGEEQSGLLDMSAVYGDSMRHVSLKGFDYLHLQAGESIDVEQITNFIEGIHVEGNATFEAKNEELNGELKKIVVNEGVFYGYVGDTQNGRLDFSQDYDDKKGHTELEGTDYLHLQAGTSIEIEQNANFSGTMKVKGNATFDKNLTVSGATKLNGATTIAGKTSFTNETTIENAAWIFMKGKMNVSGSITHAGDDVFNNSPIFNGAPSFYKAPKLYNLTHVSSGGHLVFGSDGLTLAYLSSSSKRYKDHIGDITESEAKKILNITPVWFQYKDGYLEPNDQLKGESIPGFYAEDVAEAIPVIAWKNSSGNIENWDERRMIPFMLKLIQILYRKVEVQS
nr:MAG TPA: tail protein [Caudoviricetes sp.]